MPRTFIRSWRSVSAAGARAGICIASCPDVPVTSVELDPEVASSGQEIFRHQGRAEFPCRQSRTAGCSCSNRKTNTTSILIDAYRGPFVPFHLLTKEFYQLVKDHLARRRRGRAECRAVDHAVRFRRSRRSDRSFRRPISIVADGNVVTVAYDGPPRDQADLEKRAKQRQLELNLRYHLADDAGAAPRPRSEARSMPAPRC